MSAETYCYPDGRLLGWHHTRNRKLQEQIKTRANFLSKRQGTEILWGERRVVGLWMGIWMRRGLKKKTRNINWSHYAEERAFMLTLCYVGWEQKRCCVSCAAGSLPSHFHLAAGATTTVMNQILLLFLRVLDWHCQFPKPDNRSSEISEILTHSSVRAVKNRGAL